MGPTVSRQERSKADLLTIIMRILLILAITTATYIGSPILDSAEPQLGEECTPDDFLRCEREIQTAYDDCKHLTTLPELLTCVKDLLAMTDCHKCFCSVLPQYC